MSAMSAPQIPAWLQHLLRRPAAVLGAGVSGRAAAGLLARLGNEVVLYDRSASADAQPHFGATEASGHALVVVSPGFSPTHEWVRAARSAGCEVMGELDLGALAWPGEIVAVTGTNGKTTVTEFLTHALRVAGRDARAVGNIGDPFCDAWRRPGHAASVAVVEVSSFQAEILRFLGAAATLWTNFAEDHLERHGTLEAYFRAKYNLVKHTRQEAVFHGPTVLMQARALGLDLPVSGVVSFAAEPAEPRLADTIFARGPHWENFLLVRAFWRYRGLPEEQLLSAARTFRLGAHRLVRLREVRGITFWNDSKATNFHAVEAALASFDAPVWWIGGGRSKGGDLAGFAARIAPRVRQAFLIGETRELLGRHLRDQAVPITVCDSLRDAVLRAFRAASSGDHVVLSPGFASFDMFTGYDDRGRHFETIVAELPGPGGRPTKQSPNPSNPSSSCPAAAGLCLQ